jgi:hypothetical protein
MIAIPMQHTVMSVVICCVLLSMTTTGISERATSTLARRHFAEAAFQIENRLPPAGQPSHFRPDR